MATFSNICGARPRTLIQVSSRLQTNRKLPFGKRHDIRLVDAQKLSHKATYATYTLPVVSRTSYGSKLRPGNGIRRAPFGPLVQSSSNKMFRNACLRTIFIGNLNFKVNGQTIQRNSQEQSLGVSFGVEPPTYLRCYGGVQKRLFSQSRPSLANHYDTLGLTPKARQSQIKESFYKLSKMYHPDVNKTKEAHIKFQEISEAYEVLGNRKLRRMYDQGFLNPTSSRSGHQASDIDVDYTREWQERGGTRPRAAPPTGRTNVYNFDEFYKQHYGEAIRKNHDAKKHYQRKQDDDSEADASYRLNLMVTLALSASVAVFMYVGHTEWGYKLIKKMSEKKWFQLTLAKTVNLFTWK